MINYRSFEYSKQLQLLRFALIDRSCRGRFLHPLIQIARMVFLSFFFLFWSMESMEGAGVDGRRWNIRDALKEVRQCCPL